MPDIVTDWRIVVVVAATSDVVVVAAVADAGRVATHVAAPPAASTRTTPPATSHLLAGQRQGHRGPLRRRTPDDTGPWREMEDRPGRSLGDRWERAGTAPVGAAPVGSMRVTRDGAGPREGPPHHGPDLARGRQPLEVAGRVERDVRAVVVGGLPHHLRRDACDDRAGGHLGALGDDGAGGHDRAGPDVGAVHHHAAHAHQDVVVDAGAVQDDAVAHGDPAADHQRVAGVRVQGAAVLHVAVRPDLDALGVGPGDRGVPDARPRAHRHRAHHDGGGRHERLRVDVGRSVVQLGDVVVHAGMPAQSGPARCSSRPAFWTTAPPSGDDGAVPEPTDLPVLRFADQTGVRGVAGGRARARPRRVRGDRQEGRPRADAGPGRDGRGAAVLRLDRRQGAAARRVLLPHPGHPAAAAQRVVAEERRVGGAADRGRPDARRRVWRPWRRPPPTDGWSAPTPGRRP